MEGKATRYWAIDALRGVAIINMIVYHALWDLVYLFDVPLTWYKSTGAYIWQQFICWTFIIVSGFSFSLGKRKIKRGILVLLVGTAMSVVTAVFMPETKIVFGVLTCIGSCMLIVALLDKTMKKLNSIVGIVASIAMFVLTKNINDGYLGFEKWNILKLPEELYCNDLSTYLGFMEKGFYSSDYFSLFPWLFLFIFGYYLFKLLEEKKKLHYFQKSCIAPIEWMGRRSLWIYIVHQPIIYFILSAIFKIA